MVLRPGDTFANFVVRARLGHGGSSEVYLAEELDGARPVSLKILGPQDSRSATARAHFVHEFELLSALRHPDIVRMYRHGEADGRLWSAHEYIAGTTAAALVRMTPRRSDLPRTLDVLGHIAAGLDFAHANGVVHLDIKPANILVGAGTPAVVKISDFDQARWLHRPEPALAVDGIIVVSVPYAAPELLRASDVCPATDQYALACSAVELLTGTTPFRGTTLMATAQAQLHAPPPTISGRRRWIPAEVDAVLGRALAKDPGARYDTCGDLVRRLTEAFGRIESDPALHRLSGRINHLLRSRGEDTVSIAEQRARSTTIAGRRAAGRNRR
ncbi:serine/threonine-protein kinase [Nocardia sp. NPDC052254]|uniref:serine/threonine-protein kinase n=1 Tax=Nocardia sp. NPDC052254 TaxID=3155681 RepID=UPI00341BD958